MFEKIVYSSVVGSDVSFEEMDKAVFQRNTNFKFCSQAYREDKSKALNAVALNGMNIEHVGKLATEREVVLKAVQECGIAWLHVHESLKADDEVLLTALQNHPVLFGLMPDKFKRGYGLNLSSFMDDLDRSVRASKNHQNLLDKLGLLESGVCKVGGQTAPARPCKV